MIIYVDIDDTICYIPKLELGKWTPIDYNDSVPFLERIDKINKLYDEGHYVVYYTARGSLTGKDWTLTTKRQLDSWGAKYKELRCDKPFYDIFIDDKALNKIEDLDNVIYSRNG